MLITFSLYFQMVLRPKPRRRRYPSIRWLPMHFWRGENNRLIKSPTTGPLRADGTEDDIHSGGKRFCENMFDRLPRGSKSRNALAGTRFVIPIRRCCEVWALNSRSCRSCYVTQRCDPHWMRMPRRSRRPTIQRRQPCCRWSLRMKPAEPRSCRHLLMLRCDETLRREERAKRHPKGHENVPFWVPDRLCQMGTTLLKEWRGRRDSNSRPLP